MNRLQEFLQRFEESTIKDIASYGVAHNAPEGLIYNDDLVNFFDRYHNDIESVIIEHVESIYGGTYYDLTNYELMEELRTDVLNFTYEDEALELAFDMAYNAARADYSNEWEDMDEDEQDAIIMDYTNDAEPLPTNQDKIYFVWLALELEAQRLVGDE